MDFNCFLEETNKASFHAVAEWLRNLCFCICPLNDDRLLFGSCQTAWYDQCLRCPGHWWEKDPGRWLFYREILLESLLLFYESAKIKRRNGIDCRTKAHLCCILVWWKAHLLSIVDKIQDNCEHFNGNRTKQGRFQSVTHSVLSYAQVFQDDYLVYVPNVNITEFFKNITFCGHVSWLQTVEWSTIIILFDKNVNKHQSVFPSYVMRETDRSTVKAVYLVDLHKPVLRLSFKNSVILMITVTDK